MATKTKHTIGLTLIQLSQLVSSDEVIQVQRKPLSLLLEAKKKALETEAIEKVKKAEEEAEALLSQAEKFDISSLLEDSTGQEDEEEQPILDEIDEAHKEEEKEVSLLQKRATAHVEAEKEKEKKELTTDEKFAQVEQAQASYSGYSSDEEWLKKSEETSLTDKEVEPSIEADQESIRLPRETF